MPNLNGKNGHGTKNWPDNDALKEKLLEYARRQLRQNEKLVQLRKDFDLNIGGSTLNRVERRLAIPSVKRSKGQLDEPTVRQAVVDEVERDVRQANGPAYVTAKLRNKLVMVPRDTVNKIMHQEYPEGFMGRFPGKKHVRIPRKTLMALGVFHELAGDGHEKLGPMGLQMGGIGLPMYGYKDKWSDELSWFKLVPNCRTAAAGGHWFLDLVSETGAIPIQLNTDAGSEVGWMHAFMTVLREQFAPEIDPEVYPAHVVLKSIHNIIIEGFWRWFADKSGLNLKQYILQGKETHIYNPSIGFHSSLFYWVFVPLIQAEMDTFKDWWNHHRIRSQVQKDMPSGFPPFFVAQNPHILGGLDCRIAVPREAVQILRDVLTEEVGPKEEHLSWFSMTFHDHAEEAYESIGRPEVMLKNGWDVFRHMAGVLSRNPAVYSGAQ